eukprot:1149562-Pelagomonas_calceolata.AAC.6
MSRQGLKDSTATWHIRQRLLINLSEDMESFGERNDIDWGGPGPSSLKAQSIHCRSTTCTQPHNIAVYLSDFLSSKEKRLLLACWLAYDRGSKQLENPVIHKCLPEADNPPPPAKEFLKCLAHRCAPNT